MKLKSVISKIRKNVYVKEIMSTDVLNLDKDDTVYKAIKVMADKSISTIVTIHGDKPVGIITERDLVKKLLLKGKDPKKVKIKDIMTKNPISITPDTSILRASNVMRLKNVRKLVVVDENKKLVGILSQTDIINSMQRIDNAYKKLFISPSFSVTLVVIVVILFILNYILFKQ